MSFNAGSAPLGDFLKIMDSRGVTFGSEAEAIKEIEKHGYKVANGKIGKK